MKVGITGTRKGMTASQRTVLTGMLDPNFKLFKGIECDALVHGDCIGVDEQAHDIAVSLGIEVFIYPPTDDTYRAYCNSGKHLIAVPQQFLYRNKSIVNTTDVLIAIVAGYETRRSGTWSTVRYARKCGKPIHIIYPDGTVFFESDLKETYESCMKKVSK